MELFSDQDFEDAINLIEDLYVYRDTLLQKPISAPRTLTYLIAIRRLELSLLVQANKQKHRRTIDWLREKGLYRHSKL